MHPEFGQRPQIRLQPCAATAVRASDRERRGLNRPRRHQIVSTNWTIIAIAASRSSMPYENRDRYIYVRRMSLLQEKVFVESPKVAPKKPHRKPHSYAANSKTAFQRIRPDLTYKK